MTSQTTPRDANQANSPLVTIAIPTYNRASGYLKNAIECAIAQDYDNLEVIICDNCSTDNTAELVGLFTEQHPFVRYSRHAENIGANNNFNHCLHETTGDYFLMLHDDDAIDPEFVSKCMATLDSETTPGMIRTGTRIIDTHGAITESLDNHMKVNKPVDFIDGWFNRDTAMYLCSTLFNTEALRQAGGFLSPQNLLQDAFAEVRIAANHPVNNVIEPLASFRIHPGEMTHAARVIDWCDDSKHLLDLICELFPEHQSRLRAQGNRFFSALNYRRIDSMPWSAERVKTYWHVAREFDNASPALPRLLNTIFRKISIRFRALYS